MTSWNTFESQEPELAARARAIIGSTTNCVLATIRADGSPRASGIDPFFLEGHLMLGCMPDSRKAADMRRDPRIALHGIPWESRKVRESATDPGDGDAKLSGRAVEVTDGAENERIMAQYWASQEMDAPGPADLFTLDIETAVIISVDGDELVIDRWSVDGGRTTVRRT